MSVVRLRAAVVVGLLGLSACASASGGETDVGGRTGRGADGQITIFAASSMTDVLTAVTDAYLGQSPDVDVRLQFGGSSALREQLRDGADADLFVSANPEIVQTLFDEGIVLGPPVTFATTRLVIATPQGNPAHVTGLESFADDELLVGLCDVSVPCGGYGAAVLREAGVEPVLDTEERDVRSLLAKIVEGELDAGIVYFTDVLGREGEVDYLEIPGSAVTATYVLATVEQGNQDVGSFWTFLFSPTGRQIMTDHGFGQP